MASEEMMKLNGAHAQALIDLGFALRDFRDAGGDELEVVQKIQALLFSLLNTRDQITLESRGGSDGK